LYDLLLLSSSATHKFLLDVGILPLAVADLTSPIAERRGQSCTFLTNLINFGSAATYVAVCAAVPSAKLKSTAICQRSQRGLPRRFALHSSLDSDVEPLLTLLSESLQTPLSHHPPPLSPDQLVSLDKLCKELHSLVYTADIPPDTPLDITVAARASRLMSVPLADRAKSDYARFRHSKLFVTSRKKKEIRKRKMKNEHTSAY
jgi:hypothetical protein